MNFIIFDTKGVNDPDTQSYNLRILFINKLNL